MQASVPLYIKIVFILLGLYIGFEILAEAQELITLLILSGVLSMLLLPLNKRLESFKIPRIPAILISLIFLLIIIFLLGLFIYKQVNRFVSDLDILTTKFSELVERLSKWFENFLGLEKGAGAEWLERTASNTMGPQSAILNTTISFTTSAFYFIWLTPIFVFFILYYRDFFKKFILMQFREDRHSKVNKVLKKTELVVQSYLTGLLIVISIISVLNILGLSLLGIKYAFFFGLLAGILNIIPYFGVFIGSILPVTYTYITEGSIVKALAVGGVMWIIQILEGNFITPNVIGSKVSLNPFAAILALLIGGSIWGPIGMILFIPVTAVIKVLCDSVPGLTAYGYLLGEPEGYLKKRRPFLFKTLSRKKRRENPPD